MGKVNDRELAAALATTGGNRTAAAELVGCSRRTVQNRLTDPAFCQLVDDAQAERAALLENMGASVALEALAFLHRVLTSSDDPVFGEFGPCDKFKAAELALRSAPSRLKG